MELSIEELEQIERYITHQLPDNQLNEIEKRMETNLQYREAVEAARRSRSFLDRAVRLDEATQERLVRMARSVIKQLDAQQPVRQPTPVAVRRGTFRRVVWGAVAMAAMLALVCFTYLLYSPLNLANADLDAGVHRDALQSVNSSLRPAERQALDDFLTANALYTNGEYAKAITHYERVVGAPISRYLLEATHYNLAISYLKVGNPTKAQQYWKLYEETIDAPHYPSTFIDRTRIRTRLFFAQIFA
jgi:tetratricopeptide (TPR) repeat protein